MNTDNKTYQLYTAITSCLNGGNETMKIYHNQIDIDYKSDASPVTNADIASNTAILEILRPTRIPILSEEGKEILYGERKKWKQFWLIDPLDGTKEFISKNGEFTINVALIENGVSVLGAVYTPASDELYFGSIEHGAFKCQGGDISGMDSLNQIISKSKKISVDTNSNINAVMVSRSHLDEKTTQYIKQVEKEKGITAELVAKGSSLKICQIAEGKAFLYPRFGRTMEWDIAAGHAVLSSAGGSIIDVDQKEELKYNKEDLGIHGFIASNE